MKTYKLFLSFLISLATGYSCSIIRPTDRTVYYNRAEKVFSGTLVKSENVGEPITSLFGIDTLVRLTIKVERVWKGNVPETIILHQIYNQGSGCGDDRVGQGIYLFFVHTTDDQDWGDLKLGEKFIRSFASLPSKASDDDEWLKDILKKFSQKYGNGKTPNK